MKIVTSFIYLETRGNGDTADITDDVSALLKEYNIQEGLVHIFFPGSTGAITTIEFENGVVNDLIAAMERNYPRDIEYLHNRKWHDGNGHSHVRAAVLGPSLTVPFNDKQLLLGTWQQIIVVDFDTRPRKRKIVVQIQGI